MKNKGELAGRESQRWVSADDYIGALARRRTERKKREPSFARTQPEAPRLLLSTVPFVALIGALAVLAARGHKVAEEEVVDVPGRVGVVAEADGKLLLVGQAVAR